MAPSEYILYKVPRSHHSNLMCAMDVETTGLEGGFHEIVQIAIQPLDCNYEPREGIHPFYLEMKPEYPERASKKAMQVNGMDLTYLSMFGTPQETATDMLIDWFKSLKLAGNSKIIPLAHNWPFDYSHISSWLGPDLMSTMFSPHARDSMQLAITIGDVFSERGDRSPFSLYNLKYLCRFYGIPYNPETHDALHDSLTTAKLYIQLLNDLRGLL